ncbi:phage tail protein [Bradyrhizobium nitroreducens]|uniref:Phage tail protein n=1 Tax=Bradyrhizobium nitroreducens TaxID=709803 RepID=A0A2M6UCE2_9BRAD|nr:MULTISPECIES: tail fiber protein [Bradyrhizobium]PIT02217.1 phage tail protein [Bradyrhizobium nitroreducens]TQF39356.1 phage tail protein [Bradyrhizobium sp. UNPF46]
MSTPYVGEIQAFPFAFAVGGFNNAWLPCFGQLVAVQAFTPLFALIGTNYGGNGTTNFALPNLNGAVTISQGTGPGLQPRVVGESIGSSQVSLIGDNMAMHTHALQLGSNTAQNAAPGPGTGMNMVALNPVFNGFVDPPGNLTFSPNAVTFTGQSLPHDNMQPTQALIMCIAYAGIFPSFP